MKKSTMVTAGVGVAAAVGLALGGSALANADQTTPSATSTSSATAPATPGEGGAGGGVANGNTDPSKPMRSDEKLLTGDTLTKVTAAAKATEPTATIQRVETDSDGVYEAHMVRTDGTPIIVQVGADFAVTTVQVGGPGGHGGGRGGGPGAAGVQQGAQAPSTSGASATA